MVGIVVAAIVILMVGTLGSIAYKSYNDLRKHSDVYNDEQFALQMIREAVRQSTSTPTTPTANSLAIVTANCSNLRFYTQGTTSLVYDRTCNGIINTAVPIISGVSGIVFAPTVSGQLVTIAFSGTKAGVTFNYSLNGTIDNRIKISRRNP
jgi:type II secretory pathway pseudopilin PulG